MPRGVAGGAGIEMTGMVFGVEGKNLHGVRGMHEGVIAVPCCYDELTARRCSGSVKPI